MRDEETKLDELGYPWWVDGLPLFFWLDEELKDFLRDIEVL